MAKTLNLDINPHKLVIITDDHGGYKGGMCLLCNASGWLTNTHTKDTLGVPRGAAKRNKKLLGNELEHTAACKLGKRLDDEGAFISG